MQQFLQLIKKIEIKVYAIFTLPVVPVFSEALFLLSPDDLGHIEDANKPGARVRHLFVII